MLSIISEQKVKTRKPHHCWGCTKEYPIGTEMERVTSVDGGEITSVYWCNTCNDFLRTDKEARDNCFCGDWFGYGDLRCYENYPKTSET